MESWNGGVTCSKAEMTCLLQYWCGFELVVELQVAEWPLWIVLEPFSALDVED